MNEACFHNAFRKNLLVILIYTVIFVFLVDFGYSQEKKRVDILQAGSLIQSKDIANAKRLIDDVILKHEDILIYCDSAYKYDNSNRVDAFGNVHINQADTLHLYAEKIYYNGNISFASAIKNVRLVNKTATLYTDTLDYNLETKIAYYDDVGTIVDSSTTITSRIGKYFVDEDILYLYINVVGTNENFMLESDSVNYNTTTKKIEITGPTTIRDSANTLYSESGWYNSETGESELLKNSVINNENQNISAKYIHYNKENKSGKASGSVRIEDIDNQSIILGESAQYSDEFETAVVTDSAVYINYNESDTLFLHADTLRMVPDTIKDEKIVTAYHNVRFFKTDLQGVCDSMVYFTRDSLIQLHRNPVIWSENHQLSADFIEMKQNSDAPDQLHMSMNSFIISKQDSGRFDQIKGKNMIGYITNRKLTNIDVDGNGQTLYYARENENIIGLNRSESSKISIQFKDGEIDRIKFLSLPEGELKPLLDLTEAEKKLSGFDWKVSLRPLTKHDIFRSGPSVETLEELFEY